MKCAIGCNSRLECKAYDLCRKANSPIPDDPEPIEQVPFMRELKPPVSAVTLSQILIAVFGLTAMGLALDDASPYRQYAAVVGILAQPFWLRETWGKWGMFAVSVGFTLIYARSIYYNFVA